MNFHRIGALVILVTGLASSMPAADRPRAAAPARLALSQTIAGSSTPSTWRVSMRKDDYAEIERRDAQRVVAKIAAELRAADAGKRDFDQDFTGGRLWARLVAQGHGAGSFPNE